MSKGKRGFTLIELLVVISIIALLLSIIMPALNSAKNQARLMVCKANSKQIGTMVSAYQAANKGKVPVIFNQFYNPNPTDDTFAANAFLSLALADFAGVSLPSSLNPYIRAYNLHSNQYQQYAQRFMPKFFSCPFTAKSDDSGKWVLRGQTTYLGVNTLVYDRKGRSDSYGTWMWRQRADKQLTLYREGVAGVDGYPKFGTLVWHSGYKVGDPNQTPIKNYKNIATRWDASDLKAVGAGSFSQAAILYCMQGQTDNWAAVPNGSIGNLGSHIQGRQAGSIVILADMHVEWVKGSQVGWP